MIGRKKRQKFNRVRTGTLMSIHIADHVQGVLRVEAGE